MGQVWSRTKLNFQTKVLIPVATVMALFLVGTMWLVSSRFADQLHNETTALLSTAENQFTNALVTRADSLIREFNPIPNQPAFFSLAKNFRGDAADQRAAESTMTPILQDDLALGREIAVIAFADSTGQFRAGASREAALNTNLFYAACATSVAQVLNTRTAAAPTIQVGNSLYNAVVIPSFNVATGELLGVLAFGVEMNSAMAREVKSPGAENQVAFIAGGQVAASTLDKPDLTADLVNEYRSLTSRGSGQARRPGQDLVLEGEHFGARTGRFPRGSAPDAAGYLLLVSYEKPLQAFRDERRSLLLSGLFGLVLSSAIVWLIVRRVTQPLRQLRDSAEAVGRGDFSRRIEIHSKDELGELATVFNHMTENLQKSLAQLEKTVEVLRTTQAQLVHSEKLSAVGEFVAGVAHELNNPLSALIGFAELLSADSVDERQRSSLQRITNSAERCHKIVQSLLSFARQHPPERKLTNVNGLVDSVVDILIYELRTSNIQVTKDLSPTLPRLLVDPHQIQQVFLNIVNNARQAIEAHRPKGSIRISTGSSGQKVWIRFQDDGPGISEENLAKIFNPFFTTKPVGKGTGLGLSLTYGIIQEHGGIITAQSKVGEGTTFIIELPVTAEAKSAAAQPPPPPPAPLPKGNGKSILVVDDEEDILYVIRQTLEKQGYKIETAPDGEAALSHLTRQRYDLIISDWKMPGVNGRELYERLSAQDPAATKRMIFMTGDVLSEKTEKFLQEQGRSCLHKPFSLVEFQHAIGRVFGQQ
jgi:signal transduction histidine kinase/CheY-like chemotaxis protein